MTTALFDMTTPGLAHVAPKVGLIADPQLGDLHEAMPSGYRIRVIDNEYSSKPNDEYGVWAKMMQCARSYLVGADVPMDKFIASHTTAMSPWQQLAYVWAKNHPTKGLYIEGARYIWRFYVRGEMVEFGLPHHCHGGEKFWVSRDGVTRVLINVD